jgi:hypothetical protein
LIEKSSSHCSEETFRKLEAAVINYSTPYEHSQTELDCIHPRLPTFGILKWSQLSSGEAEHTVVP